MFDVNNRFWQFLNKLADVLMLTLVYMLCCIPIITIGAATASLFSILMEINQDQEGSIYKEFFKRLGRNFKQGTLVWLLELAVILFLVYDFWICANMWDGGTMDATVAICMECFLAVMALCVLSTGFYAYSLIGNTQIKLKELLNTAAYTAVTRLGYTVCMLVMIALAVILFSMYSWTIFLAPGIVLYQFARLFVWIYRHTPRVQEILPEEHYLKLPTA